MADRTVTSPARTTKTPDDSRVVLAHIMSNHDTNLYGTIHGGVMMKLIDDAAAAAAGRHADGPAVTVSVDRMTFLAPVRAGDLLSVEAGLERAGRTSMTVGVRVTAERWNSSGPAIEVASGLLTFVAIDTDGAPRPVPALDVVLPGLPWHPRPDARSVTPIRSFTLYAARTSPAFVSTASVRPTGGTLTFGPHAPSCGAGGGRFSASDGHTTTVSEVVHVVDVVTRLRPRPHLRWGPSGGPRGRPRATAGAMPARPVRVRLGGRRAPQTFTLHVYDGGQYLRGPPSRPTRGRGGRQVPKRVARVPWGCSARHSTSFCRSTR